jgi:glycine cleavage system aminomethyltransferase T
MLWKLSAKSIGRKPIAAILESMAGTSIDSLDAEYQTLIEGCGLLDLSERGKLALSGAGAAEFLNGQVTNELMTLAPGEGCYAAFRRSATRMRRRRPASCCSTPSE